MTSARTTGDSSARFRGLCGGVALMTDTDNTGESAVAYYDQIVLRSAR